MAATYIQLNGKTIQDGFENFHRQNPHVYDLFVKQCERAINSGKKKFSPKAIFNYLRWELTFSTQEVNASNEEVIKPKKFKLNDAYISRYSRLYIDNNPQCEKFIETRILRS